MTFFPSRKTGFLFPLPAIAAIENRTSNKAIIYRANFIVILNSVCKDTKKLVKKKAIMEDFVKMQ